MPDTFGRAIVRHGVPDLPICRDERAGWQGQAGGRARGREACRAAAGDHGLQGDHVPHRAAPRGRHGGLRGGLERGLSQGVTPENNAVVPLLQAIGPAEVDKSVRERLLRRLGMAPLPEKGAYLEPFVEYFDRKSPPPAAPKEKPNPDLSPEERALIDAAMREVSRLAKPGQKPFPSEEARKQLERITGPAVGLGPISRSRPTGSRRMTSRSTLLSLPPCGRGSSFPW